ncbi:MAG: energy transducer TonB [Methylacidiphilales bacterium]|nr:energy transducer TonB [Candidatus Methylacidiphilales bacterium]
MAEPMPVQPTPVFSQVVEKIALPQPYQLPAPAQIPQPKPQPVTRPVKNQGLAHSQTATEASPALRGAEEAKPDYLRNPPPVYPEDSREAREQGIVILLVTVSASGKPTQISLQQSSHYPRLDRAALDAVRDWKFRPASLGGVTIESQVAVPVRFELQ